MKSFGFALTLAAACSFTTLYAADSPPAKPDAPASSASAKAAPKTVIQPPDVAAPKIGTNQLPNPGFIKQHESFVKIAQEGTAELVFLGDSITAGWKGQKEIWDKAFGAYKPVNFGIGGDQTQHVLWRLENGELDGVEPKAAVVMIGTNNSGRDSAEGIARGVTKIVECIRKKSPKTKILLLAIFPRGQNPNPQREKIKRTNEIIAKLDDGKSVFFLDIGDKFVEADGTISKETMRDFLHLTAKGYQIWADAITPKLAELIK
jgi:lysophospholipase L1-like esterase